MAEKPKRGLGSGLGALFGEDVLAEKGEKELTLPISKVEPRADQPRYSFDEEALETLSESIRQYGLIQPITVRKLDGGFYQIIAGERRWRAARMAGLAEVPVRIIEADDKRAMELALVENLQREDLNPIEEARGYRTLMEEYGMTQEQASLSVGKSRSAVANSLRLLSLSEAVSAMVENGSLSAGHARALLPLKNEKQQLEVAETIISRALSVRQTETLVKKLCSPSAAKKEEESSDIVVDYVKEVERSLENALGRKIKLVDSPKRGRIELEFYGADDREELISKLMLIGKLKK
ncbi:MAG: ParB/RepB/Spo0J family partition protein [Oscillospiraceae bacterium]|nr:ParB/RepB/Spo0J family partition protein [Oscillospiraceae bacterium]